MSIFLYLIEIEKETAGEFKIPPLPQIIASHKNDQKAYLTITDDLSDLEQKLLNKDIYINHYFWNYQFNSYDQLFPKFLEKLSSKITVISHDLKSATFGLFLNHIILHQILANLYKLDEDQFTLFLENINIDRNVLNKLLVEYNYKLPVNYNYFLLIQRLFCNYKVLDLVFHKENSESHFTCQQIIDILSGMDFGDINDAYYQITSNQNYSLENKLRYIECLLQSYDNLVNQEAIIYYSIKNPKLILGLYLFNLDIEGPLNNLYYRVMNLYFAANGTRKFEIIDDSELNHKLNIKSLSFDNNF